MSKLLKSYEVSAPSVFVVNQMLQNIRQRLK